MISELLHVGARTRYSTIVTQTVQTRREPDLCSKNVDPGSSLPALQRCKHMHLRKRAFETYETALVCIIHSLRLYRWIRRTQIVDACELLMNASRCDRL